MLSVDPIGPTTTPAWIEPHDIYPSVQVSHRFANRRVSRIKDVVNLKGIVVGRLGHLAVFAAALGPLPDQSGECRIHSDVRKRFEFRV